MMKCKARDKAIDGLLLKHQQEVELLIATGPTQDQLDKLEKKKEDLHKEQENNETIYEAFKDVLSAYIAIHGDIDEDSNIKDQIEELKDEVKSMELELANYKDAKKNKKLGSVVICPVERFGVYKIKPIASDKVAKKIKITEKLTMFQIIALLTTNGIDINHLDNETGIQIFGSWDSFDVALNIKNHNLKTISQVLAFYAIIVPQKAINKKHRKTKL